MQRSRRSRAMRRRVKMRRIGREKDAETHKF